jgi:Cu2+-exporting ATPase
MLTGDNQRTADAIGAQLGVDRVLAQVLPQEKERVIAQLQSEGKKVAMVGDGINDAPALTRATVGIAIGAGTDVALDAADVVLTQSRLSDVAAAIRLSRAVLRVIRQNLFWAFFYNVIGIPLAAGVFIPVLGWEMNPMFGAVAMSVSSLCVVTNALRLNRWSAVRRGAPETLPEEDASVRPVPVRIPYEDHLELENFMETKGVSAMKKTMKINGMMCIHCEARVKKTLEALEGVSEALVSHESGTAVVTLTAALSDAALKEAVEAQGYEVTAIA